MGIRLIKIFLDLHDAIRETYVFKPQMLSLITVTYAQQSHHPERESSE